MRKLLLLLIFAAISLGSYAQRYANAKNINISGGYNFKDGYAVGAGFEKYLGATNSLRVNAQYFKTDDEIKSLSTTIDINNVLADISINQYISIYKRLFFSIGAGGTAGYQFFKFDKPDYVEKTENNRFVYGLNGVGQIEYNFGGISLFCEYKGTLLFNSKDRFYQTASLGIKKYF